MQSFGARVAAVALKWRGVRVLKKRRLREVLEFQGGEIIAFDVLVQPSAPGYGKSRPQDDA
ncbi:hypothetical protein [Stutzerimonas stutzeri]|uniref:Uncharacterized protein n=1 Tax=Stutzerimonas stutzeri TaxID=316 RepID=A0A6I6LS17_STUST|nr:hypothetical protein [Stutzerimonas stutzeri]QGZ31980.1 hypothetical protein GQA94_18705 [Stutzerimonas stutzeri]